MVVLETDIGRFVGRYSIGRDSNPFDNTRSLHFLRVKVPGGFITSQHFRCIAELSKTYGRGQAELTDRQDIQLHWIRAEDALDIFSVMDDMGLTTDMCGQGFVGPRYGDPRNIVCCPASGIELNEILNGSSLVKDLTDFFVGNHNFLDLPRKFKLSVSGCGSDCTRAEVNDLALVAVKKGDEVGFTLLVGGSIGSSLPGPRLARHIGVFIEPQDAIDVVVETLEIHRDYGNRESKAKARFKWLIEEWGLNKFGTVLEEGLGKTLERYEGPVFLRETDHEGVQPQSQQGQYYVNIPMLGGRLVDSEMNLIADLSEDYGSGQLRLTPRQNIIIPNVREKDALLRQLEKAGFSFNRSILRWRSIACPSDFCGKTQSHHAKEVLKEIVEHLERCFDSRVLDEAGFRIHISGCPNDCCASTTADIGLSGKLIKEGNETTQAYDVHIGGRLGSEARFGRLTEEKVPAPALKQKIAPLFGNYLEKREPSETLGDFYNRLAVR